MPKTKHNSVAKSKPIKLASNSKYQVIAGVVVVVAVAILGYFIFFASHASTPFVSSEAETGALTTGACTITSSGASGNATNNAVQFGGSPCTSGSSGGSSGGSGGGTGNTYCGFNQGTHPSKIMVIWEENEDAPTLLGSNMPFSKTVSGDCALATSYSANGHPSLPNYMATTAGNMSPYTTTPWTNDCNANGTNMGGNCSTSAASVFSQLGSNWKAYMESMGSMCEIDSTSSSSPDNVNLYAERHNPAVYYTNITSACKAQDFPLGTTSSGQFITDIKGGTLPLLSTVSPNTCDDGHDSGCSCGSELVCIDNWLKTWIPIITAGSDYTSGKLAILVAWDEGVNTNNTVVFGMSAGMGVSGSTGIKDGTSYNDVSITHTIDQITGQSNLGQSATSMYSGFKF